MLPMLQQWLDAVRRNHGLEHGTVTVLLARRGPRRLAGRASHDGFFIVGDVDEELLLSCAREALERMQRGEENLAVSPLCGTNIAVTGALTTAAVMTSLGRNAGKGAGDRFGNAFTLSMIGVIAAQPLGRLVQRYLTTRADVQGLELAGTRLIAPGVRKVYTRAAG
ncbi:MAG: DUF6391 domain-containing protein [Dehalococcoidia bacterium]